MNATIDEAAEANAFVASLDGRSVDELRALAAALALALAPVAPALAMQFELNNGLKVNVDTTISYGISVRTEKPDPNLIGKSYFNPALCTQNVPLAAILAKASSASLVS